MVGSIPDCLWGPGCWSRYTRDHGQGLFFAHRLMTFELLVSWGCCNKSLQTRRLKTATHALSRSSGGQKSHSKVWPGPCSRWGSGRGPSCLQLPGAPAVCAVPQLSAASLDLRLHLHVAFSPHVHRCPNLLLLTRTPVPGLGSPIQSDLILARFPLQRQALGFRISACLFGGRALMHNKFILSHLLIANHFNLEFRYNFC